MLPLQVVKRFGVFQVRIRARHRGRQPIPQQLLVLEVGLLNLRSYPLRLSFRGLPFCLLR